MMRGEVEMMGVEMRKALIGAVLLAFLGGACVPANAQDAGTAGMAAAYLHVCRDLQPGPKMLSDVEVLYGQDQDNLTPFFEAQRVAAKEIDDMTVRAACAEARKMFGRKGSVTAGYLLDREQTEETMVGILAEGEQSLPGEDQQDIAIMAAYMMQAARVCKATRPGAGFAFFLEQKGMTVDELTKRGFMLTKVLQAYQQIQNWREREKVNWAGDIDERFCEEAWRRYGEHGTVLASMMIRR